MVCDSDAPRKITDYYGYLIGDLYKGYFTDGSYVICESEREYHYLFDEYEKELQKIANFARV